MLANVQINGFCFLHSMFGVVLCIFNWIFVRRWGSVFMLNESPPCYRSNGLEVNVRTNNFRDRGNNTRIGHNIIIALPLLLLLNNDILFFAVDSSFANE